MKQNSKENEKTKVERGTIIGLQKYGAFVELDSGEKGLIHISEVSNCFVSDISDIINLGDVVYAKRIEFPNKNKKSSGNVALSLRCSKTATSSKKKYIVDETGSGFASLEYNLPKWIDQYKKNNNIF